MKKILIASLLIIFAGFSNANALTIKGNVSDENGALSRANIVIKGTEVGTYTDIDGNYRIEDNRVQIGDIIEYTHIGYANQTKTITEDNEEINVKLVAGITLEEVILSSYKPIHLSSFDRAPSHIKGIVYGLKNNSLKNIYIYSKQLNNEIELIMERHKKYPDRIKRFSKMSEQQLKEELSNYKGNKQEFLNNEKEIFKKFKEDYEKLMTFVRKKGDKYYLITDDDGNFEVKSKLISKKRKYSFEVIDFSNKYKTKKTKKYAFKENESVLDLGVIKIYTDCDDSGGSFDSDCLFPAWASKSEKASKRQEIRGIYGKNNDGENGGEKIALSIIPNIINIILKFISPIVVAMFIFAGIKFIYAGSDEEDITSAKDFFIYASIGLAFIIMSYTLMKVVYYFLK